MISEFRKSVQSILYEKINSPLSGAFFLSWIVWNWKPVYYLIFNNYDNIKVRLDYVQQNYTNWEYLILYPILSTIFLIVVYPFVSTYAYKIWLWFKTWQNNIKNEIEKNTLLTLEQSVELRMEMRNKVRQYDEIIRNKESEIAEFKDINEKLIAEKTKVERELRDIKERKKRDSLIKNVKNLELPDAEDDTSSNDQTDKWEEDYFKFKKSSPLHREFWLLIEGINIDGFLTKINIRNIGYYTSNNIIVKNNKTNSYSFTDKGNYFVKKWYEEDEKSSNKK